ncbi:MAG: GAF domain-containing protein [Cyanobacteria bacterium SBLK]|nr:GAF domain-containing protein [Cyanobacteria bacterium SBLK]
MTRYALIIGLSEYQNFTALPKTTTDAETIACILEQYGDFRVERLPKKANVQKDGYVMKAGSVSEEQFWDALQTFRERAKQQEALIYFTGHGFTLARFSRKQKGYLATSDCRVQLQESTIVRQNNGIELEELAEYLQEGEFSSLVMMLDCCHSGSLLAERSAKNSLKLLEKRDTFIIAACREFETAKAVKSEEHSVFSGAVIGGLGRENADRDRKITCNRLFDFIRREIGGRLQEPVYQGSGGGIVLVNYTREEQKNVSDRFAEEIIDLEQKIREAILNLRRQRRQIVIESTNLTKSIRWLEKLRQSYNEALAKITGNIGQWMQAERTTIYFMNEDKDQLWSIFAQHHEITTESEEKSLEITVRVGRGIAGEVAESAVSKIIPYPAYDHKNSEEIRKQDRRNNFKTYTLLTIPVINESEEVFAVIQFVNKLRSNSNDPSIDRHEQNFEKYSAIGFTRSDLRKFIKLLSTSSIQQMLEGLQDYYNLAVQLKGSIKSTQAAEALSSSSQDLTEALQQVMDAAKILMNADRSTLWLLDRTGQKLWTEIPAKTGKLKYRELSIRKKSFAGQIVKSSRHGNYSPLNIPLDVHEHPDADMAKQFDRLNNYRTCSLLCMPVSIYDEKSPHKKRLIGVTQLVNKTREGFPPYQPIFSDEVPECFEISFGQEDIRRMAAFNAQAAMVIQNAREFSESERNKILYSTLDNAAIVAQHGLGAEKVMLYLNDRDRDRFWTLVEEKNHEMQNYKCLLGGETIEKVARSQQPEYIADPKLRAKRLYDRSRVIFPLINRKKELLAIIEARGKLIRDRGKHRGFERTDIEKFLYEYSETVLSFLNSCLSYYEIVEMQQRAALLKKAQSEVLNAKRTDSMERVMAAARNLINADRCTLWRFDPGDRILIAEGYVGGQGLISFSLKVPLGKGYVGKAAEDALENEEGELKVLKVDFDLYGDRPRCEEAVKADRQYLYRTCSLLCLPIFNKENELMGVLQLVNKRREGDFLEPSFQEYSEVAPECFRMSFSDRDVRQLEEFNRIVGTLIYEDIIFEEIRQKTEEFRQDIIG